MSNQEAIDFLRAFEAEKAEMLMSLGISPTKEIQNLEKRVAEWGLKKESEFTDSTGEFAGAVYSKDGSLYVVIQETAHFRDLFLESYGQHEIIGTRFFSKKIIIGSGYLKAYQEIKDSLEKVISQLVSIEPIEIYFSGLRIGGAIAALAAYFLDDVISKEWHAQHIPGTPPPTVAYLYGSPKVGNIHFAKEFTRKIDASFVLVSEEDIAPRLPVGDYAPIPKEFIISSDEELLLGGWASIDPIEEPVKPVRVFSVKNLEKMIERYQRILLPAVRKVFSVQLHAKNVHKYFGGVKALNGATVAVEKGKLTSLIGPNGSGKSTFFNVITGFLQPEETEDGTAIRFKFHNLRNMEPDEIALLGMLRTFQHTRNFPKLTVLENMLVSPSNQLGESILWLFLGKRIWRIQEAQNIEKAMEILKFLEIDHVADHLAEELSGGQQKLLALGRLLMSQPSLLLLDEPVAGVNPTLANKIFDFIVDLRNTQGIDILLIEHNMDVVMAFSDEIFVMADGKVIAQGTPDQIVQDRKVLDAYLGESPEEA